jgi:hypothetical protein
VPSKADTSKPAPATTSPNPLSPAPTKPDAGTKPGTSTTPPAKPVRYDPVDDPKVRDTIRTKLAEERAAKTVKEAFDKLSVKVSAYATTLSSWRINAGEGEKPPAEPDFKTLAKDAGVEFAATGSLSAEEADAQLDLGKGWVLATTRLIPFRAVGFSPNQRPYRPEQAMSADFETDFLWWQTESKPSYVPEFKDVQDQVRLSWKMLKARTLAAAKAQDYADQVNQQHKTLKEAFQFLPGVIVHEIDSFTWLSRSTPMNPAQQGSFGYTQLKGIDYAAQEFMQTVFSLEKGKAGVTMNQPKTVAYAVQLEDLQPSETVFRQQFVQSLAIPYGDPSLQAAYIDSRTTLDASIKAIEDEFDYKRLVPAQASSGSSAPSPYSEDD